MHEIVWELEVEGKEHVIEMKMDTSGSVGTSTGRLLVDEKEVSCWGPSSSISLILKLLTSWLMGGGTPPYYSGVPARQSFEIEGKKLEIRRKWKGIAAPVLFFEGEEIKPTYQTSWRDELDSE